MALAEKYGILFQNECSKLSIIVLNNLQRIKDNPEDTNSLEKMIQAADTIIGDSRFINHKELEQASIHLVKTFNHIDNAKAKAKEVEFFIKIFSKIRI